MKLLKPFAAAACADGDTRAQIPDALGVTIG